MRRRLPKPSVFGKIRSGNTLRTANGFHTYKFGVGTYEGGFKMQRLFATIEEQIGGFVGVLPCGLM